MNAVRALSLAAAILGAVATAGCDGSPVSADDSERLVVVSPAGWCKAYVADFDFGEGTSQVLLSFDDGRCGSGAVSFRGRRVDLGLRWIDSTTLEVAYPRDVQPERNASGEVIQCLDRKVRVLLAPH